MKKFSVLIISVIVPLLAIIVLSATLLASSAPHNWFNIVSFPCDAMGIYGLGEMLALNMVIASSDSMVRKMFGIIVILLFALALPLDAIKSSILAVALSVVLFLASKKISKSNNKLFHLFVVGVVTSITVGQVLSFLSGRGYAYTLTILLLLATISAIIGIAYLLHRKCPTCNYSAF